MPFKHKLSRRLATLYLAGTALLAAGCADAPTDTAAEEVVSRPASLDPALAVTSSSAVGQRIITDRHVQVFSLPSRRSRIAGSQRDRVGGTVLEGPTPITYSEPYALFRVDFDAGVDGWVYGHYISLVSPVPPPPPPPPAPAPVASISVTPTSTTLAIGGSVTIAATLRDSAGNVLTGRAISWASSNGALASVSSSGTITALAAGSASVTATSEGRTASVSVAVPAPVVNVATVTLSPSTATLAIGAVQQLSATVRDSAGNVLTGRTITWATSNAALATVSASGSVVAVASGTATITGSTGGRSGTATITISAPVPPPPPPPPPPPSGNTIFASNWNTMLGNSQTAFLDSNNPTRWLFACCNGAVNTNIATAASLGLQKWPVANVYRVATNAGWTSIPTHQVVADIGEPTAGAHRYFRYYLQVAYGDDHGPSSEGNIEHGVETSPATSGGGRGMNFYRIVNNDGTWYPAYRDINLGWRFIAPQLRLAKNRTYRMEWHLAYGATTYTVEVRIYNEDGILVATEQDFFMLAPQRNTSAHLGQSQFAYVAGDHRYFRVGTNGPSSNFPMANMRDENLFLHGAVAVCATSWCGPVAP